MPSQSEPSPARPWSLRRRVLLLTTTVTATAWLVGGMAMFLIQRHVSDSLFDQRLRDIASMLLTFADHEIDELQQAGGDIVHLEGSATLGARYKYQIWSSTGDLLLVSVDTERTPFAPFGEPGFSTRLIAGQPMRVVVVPADSQRKLLEVAEPLSARSAGEDRDFLYLIIPLVLSLAVLMGVGAWIGRRTTRALGESARQVTQRSPEDLRPLAVDHPPEELTPIIAAINALFARIESVISSERRFTSAAAHELRTPLAAIKIQAQVAMLTKDPAEQHRGMQRLLVSIDAASRMIDQLLNLSRIDGLIALKTQTVHLQLDAVAAHVIDEIRPIAARRQQVVAEFLAAADIDGLEFGIAVLLRNLIENAMRYGPDGGTIRVSTGTDADRCFLMVEDAGPGIAPEHYRRVFERFYRLAADSGVDGCGIGLSIVQAVVELHRASIELGRSDMGGLRVTVRFAAIGAVTPAASPVAEAAPHVATALAS